MTTEPDPGKDAVRVLATIITVSVLAAAAWLSLQWGSAIADVNHAWPASLPGYITGFKDGTLVWPAASTGILVVLVAAILAAWVWVTVWRARRSHRRRAADAVDRLSGADSRPMEAKARATQTKELHPEADVAIAPGLLLGTVEGTRTPVYHSWRQCAVYVMGPGKFKTTAYVVPHVVTAPGAALVTSNKLDGIPEILAGRRPEVTGGETVIFDPQQVMGGDGRPTFTFDPFAFLEDIDDAREIARIFERSTIDSADSGGNAQFDTQGRNLLACCLLAASLDGMSIQMARGWVMDPEELGKPLSVLKRHGDRGAAEVLEGIIALTDKTRSGVVGTAQRMFSGMANERIVRWAVPQKGVPQFDPATFIADRNTLVLLSRSGGPSGALMTCLVRVVCKAAQQAAGRTTRRRLPVPMVVELDECANVVKWDELPELFSFYGSLGIVVSAYFQSRSQGEELFGRTRFQALLDAAEPVVYGGGSLDTAFLESISQLLGDYDAPTSSTSVSNTGTTHSQQTTRRKVMSVSELADLDSRLSVVMGEKRVIVRKAPYFEDKKLNAVIAEGFTRAKADADG